MKSRANGAGETTRNRLITTGERLFAELGVASVDEAIEFASTNPRRPPPGHWVLSQSLEVGAAEAEPAEEESFEEDA